jgi:hypothetical protein
MAIKRLEDRIEDLKKPDREYAAGLIEWFKSHRDGVIQGAWYPDNLINDKSNKHVLKFRPADNESPDVIVYPPEEIKELPREYLTYQIGENSPVRHRPFAVVDKHDNLPNRCESLAESFIDQLMVQYDQDKGSPVAPTDNQVALWLFMLSHYIADAHVPVHCDGRQFSAPPGIHAKLEGVWDKEIRKYYCLDEPKERFIYDKDGYPALEEKKRDEYQQSFLKTVTDKLAQRKFDSDYGKGNDNTWDFMNAVCHRSYLISYSFFPPQYQKENVTTANWQTLAEPADLTLEKLSIAVMTDATDSVARVWFRIWRRYQEWYGTQEKKRIAAEAKVAAASG